MKHVSFLVALFTVVLALGSPARSQTVPASAFSSCGARLEPFKPCETCAEKFAFSPGGAWHGLAQCMRQIRNNWSRNGALAKTDLPGSPTVVEIARNQVLREMSSKRVAFRAPESENERPLRFEDVFDEQLNPKKPVETAALINDLGQPYNAMGQTGVAYFLYHFSTLAGKGGYDAAAQDAKFYLTIARAAARTVRTPTAAHGLMSEQACDQSGPERCAWFHSVTRRDLPATSGGTLNQMLHAVRDFGMMADQPVETDQTIRDSYEKAVTAGLNQLVRGKGRIAPGDEPNLKDFVYPKASDGGGRWAYYGLNTDASGPNVAYFLSASGGNCSYQVHVLALFQEILVRQEKRGSADSFEKTLLACGSPLLDFYVAAKAGAGPGVTPSDPQLSCPAGIGASLAKLDKFYSARVEKCRN